MWGTQTVDVVDRVKASGDVQMWAAHHTGYSRIDPALRHDREVALDGPARRLRVVDRVTGSSSHHLRLFWHLGLDVDVALTNDAAELRWEAREGTLQRAHLHLPPEFAWSAHEVQEAPVRGWHSSAFGIRVPTTTLVGTGHWTGWLEIVTDLALPAPIDDIPAPAGCAAMSER
jgi:hypothetical protein